MKTCRESRNIALPHLNLGARRTPSALTPGKDPSTLRIREGGVPQSRSGHFGVETF